MKGDTAVVQLVNGGTQVMKVEVGGRRITLEEPGAKESFFILREHAGGRISQRIMVHKDQLASLALSIGEDDYAYKGE